MESKALLLNHFLLLRDAIRTADGEAFLNVENFVVDVRLENLIARIYPNFVVFRGQHLDYSRDFTYEAKRFAGWRANQFTRFSVLIRKLDFKAFVQEHAIPTPRFARTSNHDLTHLIIKRNESSFGAEIKGPFKRGNEPALDLEAGEYYEEFKPGKILKIWYWMDQPVCAELKSMPSVVGDGVSTLEDLIANKPRKSKLPVDTTRIGNVLDLFSLKLSSVLPNDKNQIIDFCYTSVLDDPGIVEEVLFVGSAVTYPWAQSVAEFGKTFWAQLKNESWDLACYTVDAIVDDDNGIWLLELNCNPFIHPAVYAPMVQTICSRASSRHSDGAIPLH